MKFRVPGRDGGDDSGDAVTHTVRRCDTTTPHDSHTLEWVDMHFKNQSLYCYGVCESCWPFENQYAYYPYVHGPGEHK